MNSSDESLSNVTARLVPLDELHPAHWNPRTIRDERFVNLCRSIEADPAFLARRPVLAQADGTIYAGSMRYRAAQHLGMSVIPAIIEDVPDRLARERALRDNQLAIHDGALRIPLLVRPRHEHEYPLK